MRSRASDKVREGTLPLRKYVAQFPLFPRLHIEAETEVAAALCYAYFFDVLNCVPLVEDDTDADDFGKLTDNEE